MACLYTEEEKITPVYCVIPQDITQSIQTGDTLAVINSTALFIECKI